MPRGVYPRNHRKAKDEKLDLFGNGDVVVKINREIELENENSNLREENKSLQVENLRLSKELLDLYRLRFNVR